MEYDYDNILELLDVLPMESLALLLVKLEQLDKESLKASILSFTPNEIIDVVTSVVKIDPMDIN